MSDSRAMCTFQKMYGTGGSGYLFRRIAGTWGLFCLPLKEKAAAMRGLNGLDVTEVVKDVCKEVMGGFHGCVKLMYS